jgi:two-component system, LuxR family, response regulator FixJ
MQNDVFVHVIDDDDAARDALRFMLEAAGVRVHTYESASEFLTGLAKAEPGCVITDVRMPEITGIELLERLKSTDDRFPVIVITGHGDIPLAVEAMKLGAADFFEKPYDDEALLAAVQSALNRQQNDAERQAAAAAIRSRLATLSQRERQVLDGLVAGHPNKIIAHNLQISPRTIEIYRANVMTKMEASSLSELVRMALIAGASGATNS